MNKILAILSIIIPVVVVFKILIEVFNGNDLISQAFDWMDSDWKLIMFFLSVLSFVLTIINLKEKKYKYALVCFLGSLPFIFMLIIGMGLLGSW
jgi:hypothetical protein